MKRTAVIIFTIAILGLVGVYAKTNSNTHQLVPASKTEAATSLNQTTPTSGVSQAGASTNSASGYKDGTYTGNSEDTPYGTVQIAIVVSGGKITEVNFVQMPSDQPESQQRTSFSEPLLKQETISKQSANIDFVSGATSTSYGYQQSLQAALNQAALS